MSETTALGAAMAAGAAVGVWNLEQLPTVTMDTFSPTLEDAERDAKFARWQEAVKRALHWD